MSRVCQLITHLQLFTSEDTVTKEKSLINEPEHVSIGLQLLEMRFITTPNQTILNVCTRYIFQRDFLEKKSAILQSAIMKKIQ